MMNSKPFATVKVRLLVLLLLALLLPAVLASKLSGQAAWTGSELQPDKLRLHAAQTVSGVIRSAAAEPQTERHVISTHEELMARIKQQPFLHSEQELSKAREVEVVATGYTAGPESTGKRPGDKNYGITYSGVKVRRDVYSTVAADPKLFPIGTELYIPGYGYGIVADTGSAIKGHKLDLYFDTKHKVYQEWGKRTVRVIVLSQGTGKLTEAAFEGYNRIALPVSAPVLSQQ